METRRGKGRLLPAGTKPTALPADYLKMVGELLTTHFDGGLKALAQLKKGGELRATGHVLSDEVILSVSLMHGKQLSATTVHASCDFDPRASAPTVQDLLAACVDAIGAVFDALFAQKGSAGLNALAGESLSEFTNVPFEWTPLVQDRHKVFVKLDKSNPVLEQITDAWLTKNDPEREERERREHEETEKMFVTGPKKSGGSDQGGGGRSGMSH